MYCALRLFYQILSVCLSVCVSVCLCAQLLERQRCMESMVELLDLYSQQDEAYGDLVEATTELYHYLLQPFRDMRELAMLRRQQIKVTH